MEEVRHLEDYQKLVYLIERKRFDMAKDVLATALAKDPNHIGLRFMAALVDFGTGRFQDSETTLKEIISQKPDFFEAKSLLADVYVNTNEFEQAEYLLIDLIREFPEEPQYFASYANLMLQTMHLDKAEKLATEALRLEPNHYGALTVSILCSISNGNNLDAQGQLASMLEQNPDSELSATMLYAMLVDDKQYRPAMRIAQELLRSDPLNPDYLEMVKELRVVNHPAMLPLYPLQRWGWFASAIIWLFGVVGIRFLAQYIPTGQALILTYLFVGYIAYSWIAPPILRRILR